MDNEVPGRAQGVAVDGESGLNEPVVSGAL